MTLASGTSITIGGVTCQELPGSGKVSLTQQGPQGERNFHCAWADRFSLARELKGYVRADTQSPPKFFRVAPAEFPDFGADGGIPMICQTVNISGVGTMSQDASGHPSYVNARVDAIYGPPQGEESDGDTGEDEVVATLDIDYHSEFITFGSFEYYWATSEQKIAEPIGAGKLVIILDKTYTQRGLPAIPEAQIRANIGHVNEAAWQGAAAETLLFTGATQRTSYTAEGRKTHDVTYHFKERPAAGWNNFYNPSANAWERIKRIGAGGTPADNPEEFFETTDFQAWFNAPLG